MNLFWRLTLWILVFILVIGTAVIYYKYQKLVAQINENGFNANTTTTVENIIGKVEYSNSFNGENFTIDTLIDYTSQKELKILSNNYTIIFLFSHVDCQPCLKDALIMVSEYYNIQESLLTDKIIAIVKSENVNETLKWKKVTNIKFPIYYPKNNIISDKMSSIKLPIIFLIDPNNRIILSLYIDQQTIKLLPSFLHSAKKFIDN